MQIKVIAADKANHYVYGSQAAWIGACVLMFFQIVLAVKYRIVFIGTTVDLLVAGMLGAALGAGGVGAWKEWVHDVGANKAAAELGLGPVNSVSSGDFKATLAGCIPVEAVLLFILLVHLYFKP